MPRWISLLVRSMTRTSKIVDQICLNCAKNKKIIVNSVGVEARGGAKNAEGGRNSVRPPPSCATGCFLLPVVYQFCCLSILLSVDPPLIPSFLLLSIVAPPPPIPLYCCLLFLPLHHIFPTAVYCWLPLPASLLLSIVSFPLTFSLLLVIVYPTPSHLQYCPGTYIINNN